MWKVVIPGLKNIEDVRCDTLDELCRLAHDLLKTNTSLKAYCVTGLGFCVYFSNKDYGVYVGSA